MSKSSTDIQKCKCICEKHKKCRDLECPIHYPSPSEEIAELPPEWVKASDGNEYLVNPKSPSVATDHEHQLKLVCNRCDATWSDPMRATSALRSYMSSIPAYQHNVATEETIEERLHNLIDEHVSYDATINDMQQACLVKDLEKLLAQEMSKERERVIKLVKEELEIIWIKTKPHKNELDAGECYDMITKIAKFLASLSPENRKDTE